MKHLKLVPYHPKSNGVVERCVQTFKSAMKAMSEEPGKVKEKLATFLFQYRKTSHSTPGALPTRAISEKERTFNVELFRTHFSQQHKKKST